MHARGRATALGERGLFLLMVVLHVLPIWSVPHFPTSDGPSHVANAVIMAALWQSAQSVYADAYVLAAYPVPNVLGHLALALLQLVVSPGSAEKILVTLYIVGFAASFRYAIASIDREARWLSLLSLPFIYNYSLYMGFYNFLLGVIVYFLLLGFWWRRRLALGRAHVVALGGLAFLVYFSHYLAYVLAVATILGLAGWVTLLRLVGVGREGDGQRAFSRSEALSLFFKPLAAFSPSMVLGAQFLTRLGDGQFYSADWSVTAKRLLSIEILIVHDGRASIGTLLISSVFAALLVSWVWQTRRRRRLSDTDGFLLLVLVVAALLFVTPDWWKTAGLISRRLILFCWLLALLFSATARHARSVRLAACSIAVVVSAGLLSLTGLWLARVSPYLSEYLSTKAVLEEGATLLPIHLNERRHTPGGEEVSMVVPVFQHASSYLCAERKLVSLVNYEAGETDYFPVRYRESFAPGRHLWPAGDSGVPDLSGFADGTGSSVDYVMLWGDEGPRVDAERRLGVVEQLAGSYELVFTSRPYGWAKVFRRVQ